MSETSLEKARRHVAEGEIRCARQTEILREMVADNHPHAAKMAQRVLFTLKDTLDVLRRHLALKEMQAAREGKGTP